MLFLDVLMSQCHHVTSHGNNSTRHMRGLPVMFSGLKMLFLMSATKKEETEYVASGQYMYELDVD